MGNRDDEAQKHKAKGIAQAKKIWLEAKGGGSIEGGENHPRIRAYLEARGIDVSRFPNGAVPKCLRYHSACIDEWVWSSVDDQGRPEKHRGGDYSKCPAMVASIVNAQGQLEGIHRTYLDPGGEPRKRDPVGPDGRELTDRKMLGAADRRAVRLSRLTPGNVLILTEGIETAAACMTATGFTAWACMNAARLYEVEIPEGLVAPACGTSVHTIVIAADLDRGTLKRDRDTFVAKFTTELDGMTRSRAEELFELPTGEVWAWLAYEKITRRYPWLTVHVAVPHQAVCGKVLSEGGRHRPDPNQTTKGVDWLDVLNWRADGGGGETAAEAHERVKRGLVGSIDFAAAIRKAAAGRPGTPGTRFVSDPSGAGGVSIGAGTVTQPPGAIKWVSHADADLENVETGPLVRARRYLWKHCRIEGARRFGLVRWGGEWWMWNGRAYERREEVELCGLVQSWLQGCSQKKRGELVPVDPTPRAAEAVLRSMYVDTLVHAETAPVWMPPVIDEKGEPYWGRASVSPLADPKRVPAGLPDPKDLLVFPNGMLSLGRLTEKTLSVEDRTRLDPLTPDLFNTTCLPFELPVEELRAILRGDDRDAVYARLCPKFYGWLADASDGEPEWEWQVMEMLGDTLRAGREIEKVFYPVGVSGSGKGVLEGALNAILGEANIQALDSTSFSDRHGLAHLVGARAATMGDAHLGGANAELVNERLKTISGGNRIPIRDLHTRAKTVKLDCRIWIFGNDLPDLRDDSGALGARMVFLPMAKGYRIGGTEDHTIKASVGVEAPGIMLLALEGLMRILARPRPEITLCKEAREIIESFMDDSAPLRKFAATWLEQIEPGQGSAMYPTCEQLYEAYCAFSEVEEQRRPLGYTKFIKRIRFVVRPWGYCQPRTPAEQGEANRKRRLEGWRIRPAKGPVVDEYRGMVKPGGGGGGIFEG